MQLNLNRRIICRLSCVAQEVIFFSLQRVEG